MNYSSLSYIGEKDDLRNQVAEQAKSLKTFKYITIGLGVAFVGALAWALLKKK